MNDTFDQWTEICNLCGNNLGNIPRFHCSQHHQYCKSCFIELKKKHQGLGENKCFCKVCDSPTTFRKTILNTELLKKIKSNPGMTKPQRYDLKLHTNEPSMKTAQPLTVESLFGISKEDLNKLLEETCTKHSITDRKPMKTQFSIYKNPKSEVFSEANYNFLNASHSPVVCPHYPCHRMIAVSSFVNHFRYEHPELKKYATERHKDTLMPFDISSTECGKNLCLAIITIYENNKIDLLRSRSTHSVIKTCRKFCRKVPVDSFWVMLSGSRSRNKSKSYILIWLFSNSTEKYFSTIELSSKNDNVSFSCFSEVNGIPKNLSVDSVAKKFNCFYISYGAVSGLLREGSELNLRIAVH